jgi:bifunctional enzyme CysN/CysC
MVLPSGKRSRVRSISTFEGELDEAFSPQAVTITLDDEIDVSRGDMLVRPGAQPHVSAQVEAMVVWMAEKPFVTGKTYWIKHTTRTVTGEIADLRYGVDVNTLEHRPATQLQMNEVGHVLLSLNQPIAHDPYRVNSSTGAFIVIDRLTNNTVGAGMILEQSERRAGGGDLWGQEPVAGRLKEKISAVTLSDREKRLGQRGVTILLYGLTGSGKATIAFALEKRLFDEGRLVKVLYGPDMRQGLCRDLGFTADDRSENLRRSAEVAKILNDTGAICICAFVAPHDAVRQKAKEVVGADRFISVYLKCPPAICRERDRTGTWAMAQAGKIAQFPGVSADFEAPTDATLVLDTDKIGVDEAVGRIISQLALA